MVGLADIPCVGKFVERISDNTVDAVFRGFKYVFRYKSLVNELNTETENLNIEKERMSRKVMEEKADGKIIEGYVLTWQNKVEEIQKSGKEPSPSPSSSCTCIQCLPIPNPINRFRIGRNAVKKTETVIKLTDTGKDYLNGEIAHLPQLINMPNPDTTFEDFPSRKETYGKLWDGLVNKDSSLVHGIYGMAGVGKTRMMENIWEDAIKKKIFDKVVRVNVGNEINEGNGNLDKIKLQDHIAGRLNCHLKSQDVESRASQLENSLRNEGKILLVLDDLWRNIHLTDIIGTPFGNGSSSSSKILLTSREKGVCSVNNCKHPVEIKTLSPDEALHLFTSTVGPDTINSLEDESLVQKVCDECGRLPLLIHAVGKALEGETEFLWKDAHKQLVMGKFEKIVGVEPQVYKCIKLSIDNLKLDDAKSCLFLCSFFPEDANIDMKRLIQLATGSQLIPDGESRVLAMVHYLKRSSLLLESGKDNDTKVHDIIRDVARSISFTDSKYAFLQVTCNSQYLPSDSNYQTRKFLRIDAENNDVYFNEDLLCPDLHTLWLRSNDHPQHLAGGFVRMFVNLSFLMLDYVKISVDQFSLQPLGNLRTLCLFMCDISKTDASLFPKNLKTLYIWYCRLPSPMDLGNLKYLRKLEIRQPQPKTLMVPNVISSLSSLEELHIPNGFITDSKEYHMEPIVTEISKLTRLRSLQFYFPDDNTFQGTTNMFSNIESYNIYVGPPELIHFWRQRTKVPSTKWMLLFCKQSRSWDGLLTRAEDVRLEESDVDVSSICNGNRRAFEDLKKLFLVECNMTGSLASISQDEIQYSLQTVTCFSKLTSLRLVKCCNLKYLFCNNIAKCLVQLQELDLFSSSSMEAIIMNESASDGEIINFRKLKLLSTSYNVRLTSFYAKNKHSGSTSSMDPSAQYQPFLDKMVALPSLETLEIKKLLVSVIWGRDYCNDKLTHLTVSMCYRLEILIPMLHRLHNLEHINVYDCGRLRSMFLPSVASDLTHLKELKVRECREMREIIEAGEHEVITDDILFPELTLLSISDLPSLTTFCCYQSGKANTCQVPLRLLQLSSIVLKNLPALKSFFYGANFEFHMPSLKEVKIDTCGLSTLFTRSVFKNLKQLEELSVCDCELLEGIFEDASGDKSLDTSDKIITLNRVSTVHLQGLPKFKSIFYGATYQCYMPALKNVKIVGCGISVLFTCSVFREIQQLEELQVSNCESLEHIIVEEAGGDKTSEINGKSIKSSKLLSITLESLPNLKSFSCTSSYVFNMPKLQKVRLIKCPQIEYFSSLETNTSAECVITSDSSSGYEFKDLNDFIRQYHKRGSYPSDNVGESSYNNQ